MALEPEVKESLRLIEDLKFFLATAPANWQDNQVIRRYYLNHDEGFVSCIYWNNLYFITGTDIVRCIVYKFEHFGRKIIDRKKFEEGIFSDLRNLKCGTDAILEPPRSEFLQFLFKNSCLRTQKKQKVFFWFNVAHDKLMADALERDLKKEKLGQASTTLPIQEPAKSFKYDESSNLYTQLADHIDKQRKIGEQESASAASTAPPASLGSSSTVLEASAGALLSQTASSAPSSTTVIPPSVSGASSTQPPEHRILDQDAPTQYKSTSDYEDDFPLDYFDHNLNPEEYITLDPNYQPGGYPNLMDDNYDFDPSVFMTSSNQVVYNDEYLIEQTQPLKTPLPPLSGIPLKSAKNGGFPDDFFTFQPPSAKFQSFPQTFPQSAKFQTSFPRHSTAPFQAQYPQSYQQVYEYTQPHPYYQHPADASFAMRHEQEYWPQYGEQVVQVPVNQPYMMDHEFNMYAPPVLNFASQPLHSPYATTFSQGNASARQYQVSANMMKKKRQMFQQKSGISKPDHGNHSKSGYGSLDDVINSKATKVVNFKKEVADDLGVVDTQPSTK